MTETFSLQDRYKFNTDAKWQPQCVSTDTDKQLPGSTQVTLCVCVCVMVIDLEEIIATGFVFFKSLLS